MLACVPYCICVAVGMTSRAPPLACGIPTIIFAHSRPALYLPASVERLYS